MLAKRIKTVRESLNLSQREFGEKLGVSRDVISNIEYGRVCPKELFLEHMRQQYHVNQQWLETGEGEIFNQEFEAREQDSEILSIFKSLHPEFQDYALKQMKELRELQNKLNP